MPVPAPRLEENEQDFVSRCMGDTNMQEYDQEQRSAICYNTYRETKDMNVRKDLANEFVVLEKAISKKIELLETMKEQNSVIKEIPVAILNYFSDKGKNIFKSVYLKNRYAGRERVESLQIAKNITLRNDVNNRLSMLKSIEKELKELIKRRPDAIIQKGYEKKEEKAEEGDTNMSEFIEDDLNMEVSQERIEDDLSIEEIQSKQQMLDELKQAGISIPTDLTDLVWEEIERLYEQTFNVLAPTKGM